MLTVFYSSLFYVLVNPLQLSKNIMNSIFEERENSEFDNSDTESEIQLERQRNSYSSKESIKDEPTRGVSFAIDGKTKRSTSKKSSKISLARRTNKVFNPSYNKPSLPKENYREMHHSSNDINTEDEYLIKTLGSSASLWAHYNTLKSELKLNSYFIIVDIWDLVQIQSYCWEVQVSCVSYTIQSIVFFYTYLILLIAPSISLSEFSKNPDSNSMSLLYNKFIRRVKAGNKTVKNTFINFLNNSPLRLTVYSTFTLFAVNLPLFFYRICLVYFHQESRVSSIWVAKSAICVILVVYSYPWRLVFSEMISSVEKEERKGSTLMGCYRGFLVTIGRRARADNKFSETHVPDEVENFALTERNKTTAIANTDTLLQNENSSRRLNDQRADSPPNNQHSSSYGWTKQQEMPRSTSKPRKSDENRTGIPIDITFNSGTTQDSYSKKKQNFDEVTYLADEIEKKTYGTHGISSTRKGKEIRTDGPKLYKNGKYRSSGGLSYQETNL